MSNRFFGLTLSPSPFAFCSGSVLLLALCFPAWAQQPGKMPRIGYVSPTGTAISNAGFRALRQGLQDLGYVDGKNILFEYRGAQGKPEVIPGLVAELVQLKVSFSAQIYQRSMQPSKQPRRFPLS